MQNELSDPRPYEQPLLTLTLLLVCVLLVYSKAAQRLDLLAYDAAIQATPAPVQNDVVIIAIDEKSLNGIGQWPWRRAIHAQLVDKLNRYNASLITFDILFSERDANYPDDDRILASAIRSASNVILPMHIHPLNYGSSLAEILPIPELIDAARALGHVHVELDQDGIARGIFLNSGVGSDHWPSLSMAMASQVNPMIRYGQVQQNTQTAPYISVQSEYRLIPFAGPRGTYPTYSYLDVMADKVPGEIFRDKIVLIGAAAVGLGDTIPTPVSHRDTPLSGVEFHANAFASIMDNHAIKPVESIWEYLLTFAFIMIPILLFPRLGPTNVMPATILLVSMVSGFSYILLRYDQTWFPPMNAVLGILLAYPLWSWQRMRHLNRFFSQELERLGDEPDLGFRKIDQDNSERTFLSLLALLKPDHYLFAQNQQIIHSFEKESFDDLKDYHSGVWTHTQNCSWIQLDVLDKEIRIALKWLEPIDRKQTKDFLDKLDFSVPNTRGSRRYYEQISNRIVQVREAISAMQDMRTFISKGFEEIPEAVLVSDPVGNIVFSNSRAASWLNHDAQALRGQSLLAQLSSHTIESEKLEQAVRKVLLYGQKNTIELTLSERDLLVHCLPFVVDDKSDAGLMLSMSDISSIRKQQREKNQLINFLSHDVRSPLVSQLAMLQGLRSGRIEWQADLVDEIERHTRRSLNLSEQFLQVTRAEQISEGEFYEFDLLNAVENAVDSISAQAKARQIGIDLKADEPVWFSGNAELIERTFGNLLSNAVKYSPENTCIEIGFSINETHCDISVKDQGHGIAADELPHVFDRFRRQRSSEIKGERGAGLGLNFVKVVTEKHGIDVSVESEVDQGTCFTLRFHNVKLDA